VTAQKDSPCAMCCVFEKPGGISWVCVMLGWSRDCQRRYSGRLSGGFLARVYKRMRVTHICESPVRRRCRIGEQTRGMFIGAEQFAFAVRCWEALLFSAFA
jgi:hypothetical protein